MRYEPPAFALKVPPQSQVEYSWCVFHTIRDARSCPRHARLLHPAPGVEGLLENLVARQHGWGMLIFGNCGETKIQEAQVRLLP